MADTKETSDVPPVASTGAESKSPVVPTEQQQSWNAHDGPVPRPAGWQYKGFKIGKSELWYASPKVQLLMVAMVCFLVSNPITHASLLPLKLRPAALTKCRSFASAQAFSTP